MYNGQKQNRVLSNASVPLSELGLTTNMSSFLFEEIIDRIQKITFQLTCPLLLAKWQEYLS